MLDPEITIDYDKIDEIYHMHESDEIGGILKPFMVDFLPKFKSYQIPEGIFRLHKLFLETLEKFYEKYSDFYFNGMGHAALIMKIANAMPGKKKRGDFIPGPMHIDFLIKMMPIVIDEAPDEKYLELFRLAQPSCTSSHYMAIMFGEKSEEFDFFKLTEVDSMTSLNEQKCYIVWYIMDYIVDNGRPCHDNQFYAMLCSVLPWRIDDPSEDARYVERRLNMNFRNMASKFETNKNIPILKQWYSFISKYVWPATGPLDPELTKKSMTFDPNFI